jgi:hypothetical protein
MIEKLTSSIKKYISGKNRIDIIVFSVVFIVIAFYLYNYFTRLETAYRCVDQKNNKVYLLIYQDLDHHDISSVNQDWVKDGISNHDIMDWRQELKKEKGNEFRYYSRETSNALNPIFFEIIHDDGEKYSFPINDYRTVIFDRKKEIYKIYEYENFRYQTEEFLLNNTSDLNFKITMKIKKELKCSEDIELYKKWKERKID